MPFLPFFKVIPKIFCNFAARRYTMAKIEDSNSCHTQHGRVIDVTGRTALVEINFSDSACNSCTIANCSRKFPEQHGKTAVVRAAIHPHADIPVAGEADFFSHHDMCGNSVTRIAAATFHYGGIRCRHTRRRSGCVGPYRDRCGCHYVRTDKISATAQYILADYSGPFEIAKQW